MIGPKTSYNQFPKIYLKGMFCVSKRDYEFHLENVFPQHYMRLSNILAFNHTRSHSGIDQSNQNLMF